MTFVPPFTDRDTGLDGAFADGAAPTRFRVVASGGMGDVQLGRPAPLVPPDFPQTPPQGIGGGSGGGRGDSPGYGWYQPGAPEPGSPFVHNSVTKVTKAVSRLHIIEGDRGRATRLAVPLRYITYFLTIILCSAFCQAAFANTLAWQSAGKVMFFSAALMTFGAALSSMFYTNFRNEIIRQWRHATFGIAVLPGTGIAAFQWATSHLLSSTATQNDSFASVLSSAIPILYFVCVCIPAVIFIKYVSGIRTLHRSTHDDQELLAAFTRNDGMQR